MIRVKEIVMLYRRVAIRQCRGDQEKVTAVTAAFNDHFRRLISRSRNVCDVAGKTQTQAPGKRPLELESADKENQNVGEYTWEELLAEIENVLPDWTIEKVGDGSCDDDKRDLRIVSDCNVYFILAGQG